MKKTPLYAFAKLVAQPLVMPFIPYTVKGREHIPQDRNFIICANHLAISDPLRLVCIEKRQIFFMSKAELFRIKPLGFLLRALGSFPVQRGKGDLGAIDHAGDILQRGDIMGIFLEGTRSKDGELGQPKAGAVMLAHQHQKPILPVCLTPVGSKLPRLFHRVIVSYGELIQPEDLGIEEGKGTEYRRASRLVMGKIAEMRERDLRELPS